MGTRIPKVALLLIAACLALSSLAWAAPAAESGVEVAVTDEAAPAASGAWDTTVDDVAAAVYYCDDPRFEAWITIGANQGLRPTAQVAFFRKGMEVARGEVITVRACDAIVKPAEGTLGGAIRVGDAVQVVENGSREAADRALAKRRGWENFLTVGLTALLAGLIAIAK